MNKGLVRKGIVFGTIVLFFGVGVIPSLGGTIIEKKSNHPIFNGNTLYVGGAGPNNYTQIQDAIDDASDGDTVFVYDDSSPYYESLHIDKSISLLGEDKHTTIIDGNNKWEKAIRVSVGLINIGGFKIQNWAYGINIDSSVDVHNIIISGNILLNISCVGIYFGECSYVIVEGNYLLCDCGMSVRGNNIFIKGNTINFYNRQNLKSGFQINMGWGLLITTHPSHQNFNISFNKISNFTIHQSGQNGETGILASLYTNSNVTFYMNEISNCYFGMQIEVEELPNSRQGTIGDVPAVFIRKNNFRRNLMNTYRTFRGINLKMLWERNYWGRPRLLPKLIIVFKMITETFGIPSLLEFDWHPALKPYDI